MMKMAYLHQSSVTKTIFHLYENDLYTRACGKEHGGK
jgi:hypothetical protein